MAQLTKQQLIEKLTLLNVRAALAGRSCPVAARVLARLESL